jgi:predicted nucleic acid-binding Zn ribbon protein
VFIYTGVKLSNEQSLREVINELIKTFKLEDGISATRVINSWEKVAGTMIFNHTEKIFIRKKKLYLKLDSPALKQELSFEKSLILKKINKSAGQNVIEEIVFL